MRTEGLKSALEMLYHWEKTTPDRIFLRQPRGDSWREYTWREVARQVRSLAQALRDQDCREGDRVAILGKNAAHWIMADLAIMMAGCVSVPLYPTQQADVIRYVLEHSDSKLLFVGRVDEPSKIEAGIPHQLPRIRFPYPDAMAAEMDWGELVRKTRPLEGNPRPALDQLATIVYTSGTTGFPKGVMHTFRTMAHAAIGYKQSFGFHENDRLFSYLPLPHVAERVLVEMIGLACGSSISFTESLDTFTKNLQSVAPTAFFSVPRLWVKFQQGILAKVPQEKLDRLLSLPFVSSLIRYKIKKSLGLHKARLIGSGAAAIAPSVLYWFDRIGIEILEGYALTENFGYATSTPKGGVRIGSVGRAMPSSVIKIDSNGEILTKSGATTTGYYKDPAATAQILSDGYLRTGDLGEVDAEGYIRITGRVKEIFKTDKGKYIAPAPIEHRFLAEIPFVEQLCITGHALPQPVALCVLNESARKAPAEQIEKEVSTLLKSLNSKLEKHEQIEHCIFVKDEWTVDAGMMTPTLKIRRHSVEARYRGVIDQARQNRNPVIWEETLQRGKGAEASAFVHECEHSTIV
jgi:long-chain acyl-CoA synthetase